MAGIFSPSPSPELTREPAELEPAAPSATPEVIITPTPDPERAVYDGDVSDAYLAKLSSYYNAHAKMNTPYIILRPSQYRYILVYGDTSNYRNFTNATVCEIEVASVYNGTSYFTVTEDVSYIVDPTGNTAFVYSSSSDFIPSRYITTEDRALPAFVFVIMLCMLFSLLYKFILRLTGVKR